MLEKKLHEEIIDLDAKFSVTSGSTISKRIQSMNQALDKLDPQSTSMAILIEQVQKSSNELIRMVRTENQQKTPPTQKILAFE